MTKLYFDNDNIDIKLINLPTPPDETSVSILTY